MIEAKDDTTTEQLLVTPGELRARLPVSPLAAQTVRETRRAVRDALHGRDPRLVAIVGPCSIHDPQAAVEYARRLGGVAEATRDRLIVLMRVYGEKPRTTVGWKGLVNDPHLDGSCDVATGFEVTRRLLLEINELGVPCASEVLDPATPRFLGDLLSWAAIGARTVESQTHRELASGLPMPVGFKNATHGGVEAARDGVVAARHPHSFPGIGESGRAVLIRTCGNDDGHLVLRGGSDGPNFASEDLEKARALLADDGTARPLLIDCSHANSHKDHRRQATVCRDVLSQVRDGDETILGVLIESHLEAGSQQLGGRERPRPGQSITDPCIGWEETEALLHEIAGSAGPAPDLRGEGFGERRAPGEWAAQPIPVSGG